MFSCKIWRRYSRERALSSLIIWLKNQSKVRYRTFQLRVELRADLVEELHELLPLLEGDVEPLVRDVHWAPCISLWPARQVADDLHDQELEAAALRLSRFAALLERKALGDRKIQSDSYSVRV